MGSWKSRTNLDPEKQVEGYLTKRVETELGGVCWKFTSPGNKGVPDRIVILNDMLCFVELKRPVGGRLSPMQKWRIKQLLKNGQHAYAIKNTDMVDELIAHLMKGDYPDAFQAAQISGVFD